MPSTLFCDSGWYRSWSVNGRPPVKLLSGFIMGSVGGMGGSGVVIALVNFLLLQSGRNKDLSFAVFLDIYQISRYIFLILLERYFIDYCLKTIFIHSARTHWSKVSVKTFIILQNIYISLISNKCCSFELYIHKRILKKYIMFYTNILK